MVMTVLVRDAKEELSAEDVARYDRGDLAAILYADDTLLTGSSAGSLQRLLNAVAKVGERFGMQLHWGKFQLIEIR